MSTKPTAEGASSQARARDRSADERSQSCDLFREDLKTAMRETGWTVDALAAHLDIHRSYVDRMLDGEKPITADRICDLPDDLEAKFQAIRTERFGLIVVAPLTGLAAQKALVAGLIGIMSAPQLPAKTSGVVKADLRTPIANAMVGK